MVPHASSIWRTAIIAIGILAPMALNATARAWEYESCVSDWKRGVYTRGTWDDMVASGGAVVDSSAICTIGGRTGHSALSYSGDLRNVYTWVCNEDGSACGIDEDTADGYDVTCWGQALPRDSDGSWVYEARIPSLGAQVGDVPMDDNANYIDQVYWVRVECWHFLE